MNQLEKIAQNLLAGGYDYIHKGEVILHKLDLINDVTKALSHINVYHGKETTKILIDREDYERLSEYKWYHDGNESIYAYGESNNKINLHKFILNLTSHISSAYNMNGDINDYRKENLKRCSRGDRNKYMKNAIRRKETNDE